MSQYQNQYFKKWYAAKKAVISAQRKKRYAEDPAYRQAILDRSAKRRAGLVVDIPENYVSLPQAAEKLGVSDFVLRYWLGKGYFPEPERLKNQMFLTMEQVQRLVPLRNFLAGRRKLSVAEREQLSDIVSLIFTNWV